MKNKKGIIGVFVFLLIIIIVTIFWINIRKRNKNQEKNIKNSETELNNEQTQDEKEIFKIQQEEKQTQDEQKEINEVKKTTGVTGNTEIYEIYDEKDSKIPVIRASVKYKVAFSGMINQAKPEIKNIDKDIEEKHPKNVGIWIREKDRKTLVDLINSVTGNSYEVDLNGYLNIKSKGSANEFDNKISKVIQDKKCVILCLSSVCYIVDDVSGEVLDYNFENMDQYQTYEYFQDNGKMIVFMSENIKGKLTNKEIIQSVFELI